MCARNARSMALAVRCGTAATAAAVPKVWSVRAFMRSIACLAPTAKVNLITLTEFDRSKLLEFNRKASRPVFTPERLYCKPNGVAAPNHSPAALGTAQKTRWFFAGRLEELKGLRTAIEALAAAGAGRTAADRGRYRPAGSLGQRERP